MQLDYIVDAEEMQRADRNTIEYFKMPQLVLMERAACAAMEAAVEKWPQLFEKSPRILIAAGNGNNGGDGAALARLFYLRGAQVTVFVGGREEKYSPALKTQMEILERYKEKESGDGPTASVRSALRILTDDEWVRMRGGQMQGSDRNSAEYDLIVDALFGIGLSREITGIYREKIEWLNGLSGKKMALDIPSGISAGDGAILGCAFYADVTVTFGFLKRGMLLYPARKVCGETTVMDIGITEESFLGKFPAGITIGRPHREGRVGTDKAALSEIVAGRRPDGHKGSFGKVLLFAGSAGAPGAALLAGEAVLRSGAGMLQIVSPAENRELTLTRLPEAMYQTLTERTDWEKLLGWCDAVVIGPGIGQDTAAENSVEKIMTLVSQKNLRKPVILDADGLNLVASSEKRYNLVKSYTAAGGIVIMTPHMTEFLRLVSNDALCGCAGEFSCPDMRKLRAKRLEIVEEYAGESGVILVSKDAATVAAFRDSAGRFRYYINQTGNSGMATAGSGDVLSGIVGALAAFAAASRKKGERKIPEKDVYFQAVYRAVYLHGAAGDRAAEKYGEESMKAGDIVSVLPEIFMENAKHGK